MGGRHHGDGLSGHVDSEGQAPGMEVRESFLKEGLSKMADVEKHMVADPVRRVGRLVVHLDMPSGLPEEARKLLEQTATTCPVKESIHPDIETEFLFHWG